MSHGVNKNAPPIVSPPPLPFTSFSPGFFIVLQAILYQHFAAFVAKNNSLSKEIISQLIAGRFSFCSFVYMFLKTLFESSVNIKLRIENFICAYMQRYLRYLIKHKQKNSWPWFDTIDTSSIMLSYLYHFGNVNKELFRYC